MPKITVVDADSIAYASAGTSCKDQMYGYIDRVLETCRYQGENSPMEIYVESDFHKHNFRHQVAISRPYKGGRLSEKPEWLHLAKGYLVDKWNAHVCKARESEDECAIMANTHGYEQTLVCCIDKDLLQLPCWFWNYNKKERFLITPEEALINLYAQILSGDSTDNIPGIPGVGTKTAASLIHNSPYGPDRTTCMAYRARGLSYHYMVEQARLIYLIRATSDVFNFMLSIDEYDGLSTNPDIIKQLAQGRS